MPLSTDFFLIYRSVRLNSLFRRRMHHRSERRLWSGWPFGKSHRGHLKLLPTSPPTNAKYEQHYFKDLGARNLNGNIKSGFNLQLQSQTRLGIEVNVCSHSVPCDKCQDPVEGGGCTHQGHLPKWKPPLHSVLLGGTVLWGDDGTRTLKHKRARQRPLRTCFGCSLSRAYHSTPSLRRFLDQAQ